MKSKRLLLMLLMAFALPWAAFGQETLTVHDGTTTNQVIPAYIYYFDDFTRSQFVVPATELADMNGGTINAVKFYTNSNNVPYTTVSTVDVYLMEVDYTTMTALEPKANGTIVYQGTLAVVTEGSGGSLTIEFSTPYTYSGGNLLVGIENTTDVGYKNIYFYGETVTGASWGGSNSSSLSGVTGSQRNFLPKTTFTYTPDPNYCGKPANVHIVENTLGPREVAIEWDAESGELFQISMQATSYFDPNDINWSDATTSHYEEWDQLTPDTDYTFCVRKKCGTDSYSQPVTLTFRTTVACPAPTLALTANSETAHGATLNWTGFSESYILQMGSLVSSEPQTIYSEGFEGGSMPTGWTSEGTTSWTVGTGDNYSSSTSHTGSYNAKSSSSTGSGNTGYLVTPVMNLSSYSNAKLSCWYMNHDWGGDTDAFGVYYRTSSTGTWNELFSTNSGHTDWTQTDELSLPSEAYVQIGFKYTDNYGYGVAVDDIEITADVVTYEWITFDNNATSPYTFTTLLPETTYNVRVIGNCGSDGQSQPSNMVSFTTLASCPVPTALNVPETTITAHEATLLWTADNDSYNIRLGEVSYLVNADFETGDFSQANFINGTYAWSVVANDHSGAYCAKSASGNNSATSALELSVTLENDLTLTFSAKVSSENGYDKAYFSIDGTDKITGISGAGNWIDYSYPLAAGTHTLRWYYTKDSSVAGNDDCFYVDDIQIVNGSSLIDTYTSNTTSYNFTHLAAETTYTAQVQGVCNGETTDWSEAISFTTGIACPAPTNLVYDNVTKNSVDLSWTETGGATEWEICVNGDEENLVGVMENPYTLDRLDPQTDYTVKVRAVCGGEDGESAWSNTISFTTVVACPAPTNLVASNATYNSVELSWTESGEATEWELCVNGDTENLIGVTENPYMLNRLVPDTEYTVKVRAVCGGDDGESQWSNTASFTTLEACAKPTNLAETNITTNSATLSWNGTSEQYVLQYRPWTQVGEDQTATGVLTTYTYDLSAFEGTGSVAIRHYDVSDMFQLNVDDIVVTNKEGTPVYTQGFEDGVIPSEISNMDLDGDGYVWSIRANGTDGNNNPYCVGNYCASSASWDQDPLFPDNWMIISGIELGGQISFVARGQDPEWSAENFAVFVSLEASSVEVPLTSTTYVANDLTPNTPYAWQVKSDCGEYQSNYVSSFFKTKDDKMFFTTDGNWNDVANWEDAEGNAATALPTIANNVQIDAEAIIPANYIAQVNKASIGTGSITIKDGGQLKQSSATLNVTVEKEIAGIGEENWDNEEYIGGWSFISSPFSGRTLYDETSVWNHVENMFPTDNNYDLYAFDPERTAYWINYKEEPSHISFESSNGNAGLMYGEGYLYASQEDRTLNFVGTTGKSNNYTETVDYTYDETATYEFNGWKLVGNFFTCDAYINYVDADNNVLDANFYVMNAAGDGYTLSESSVGLPPCTGAFINYNATGKVQYSTEALETRGSGMLSMTVSQGRANVDMARVRFGHGINLKHMSFRQNSSLYIPQDNDYAVVYTEDNVGEMPVSFKAEKNGTYSLSFNSQEVTFSYLHLIDNMTGADVNLLETPSYTFNASTTDYANRFRLVFATGSTVDGENFGFVNAAGNLCIFGIEGEATVQVVDMLGHILSSEQFSGSYEKSLNAAPGVYMIRLINGNDVKVQKIVVR